MLLLGLLAVGEVPHARAEDRIGALTASLSTGHTERERIAAVTSLARIEDKGALRPLVLALQDDSATVRGIAAVGLGKLGHRAAAPALRVAANEDTDATVRERAAAALAQVNKVNGLPPEPVVAQAPVQAKPGKATASQAKIHVTIRSTTDESPGADDAKARKSHADVLRDTLASEIGASPVVTTDTTNARKPGHESCQIDVSVVRLETRSAKGGMIEVEAQLRLTISDGRGKMLSFLSGGATMQVKRRGYNLAYLPALRRETLANAMRGLSAKLVEHLRRTITS